MILCLFLISVGVLEFILRNEGKKQQDSVGETTEPVTASAPPVTDDLLSLMRAVEGAGYGVVSETEHTVPEVTPDRKTGDAVIR